MRYSIEEMNGFYHRAIHMVREAGVPLPADKDLPQVIVYLNKKTFEAYTTYDFADNYNRRLSTKIRGHLYVSKYVRDTNEKEILDVFCHELCHFAPGLRHGAEWKHWTELVNKKWNMHIAPYIATDSVFYKVLNRLSDIYLLECPKCHQTYVYLRDCQSVRDSKYLICGHCRHRGLKLRFLPKNPKLVIE